MKVLLVTPYYYPKIGGLENYARQLALALKKNHTAEIVIVTSGTKHFSLEEVDGMKVYRLPILGTIFNTPINPFWPIMIRRIVRRERPDVIHAHTPVPGMADAAALAAGRTPFILSYHAATLLKKRQPIFNSVARLYMGYQQILFWRANKILAVSDYTMQQLPRYVQSKAEVLPNAVWLGEVAKRTQPDRARFIFIGSLDVSHGWKGLDGIIEAVGVYAAKYGDDIELVVMGEGNYLGHYQMLVQEKKLQKQISFVGAKTGTEKDSLLTQALALVAYPTTSNDAFPTVFIEAWAKQVPVISAAIGAIPGLIEDGVNGYLVAPNDPNELAYAFWRVVQDPRGRALVARKAAALTQESYTWEIQSTRLQKLLGELA